MRDREREREQLCKNWQWSGTKYNQIRYSAQAKALKETISPTDLYLVILSSKTFVFEDRRQNDVVLVSLTSYFFL